MLEQQSRLPAVPASILYSSARTPGDMHKARAVDADLYLVDLEDSVPADERPRAREAVARYLDGPINLERTAVRINPLSTADYCADVLMLLAQTARPRFVFMTMVHDPAEVTCLRSAFASAGWKPRIYATIETVSALQKIDTLATTLDGMILGSADLGSSLGIDINDAGLRRAREAMAVAAAGAGAGCIDTGNFRLGDAQALAGEIHEARALGFHGKGTVHPKELAAINAAFRPDPEATAQARRVCDAYAAARGGVCVLDGNMIGPPFARLAQMRLRRAEAWAAEFSEDKGA